MPVFSGNDIRQLLVAPTDLKPADPLEAEDLLKGHFAFAGEALDAGSTPPFSAEMPSDAFLCELAGFSWIRHLRTQRGENINIFARTAVLSFLRSHRATEGAAWRTDVIISRLNAWLCHSTVVLKGAETGFYRRFVNAILRHEKILRKRCRAMPHDANRLKASIVLAMTSIALDLSDRLKRQATRRLNDALQRQILPDGGHIARSPQTLLELLLLLLPLRQTYINLDQSLPKALVPAIDRIYPAFNFFRHRDGNLALFNGTGAVLATTLSALNRYDESGGAGFKALPHTGFHRLQAHDTVLIADTGKPLSAQLSKSAHAGTGAFELSSGQNRFIVNAGMPRHADDETARMARSTAAHSAASIDDRPSLRFSRSSYLGPVATAGVSRVEVKRGEDDTGETLQISHDGYRSRYGLFLERRLTLSADGRLITGADCFRRKNGSRPAGSNDHLAIVRFHLHPTIWVMREDGDTIFMTAPDNECWLFSAPGLAPEIEEDVFFAASSGMVASRQITIQAPIGTTPDLEWKLERLG